MRFLTYAFKLIRQCVRQHFAPLTKTMSGKCLVNLCFILLAECMNLCQGALTLSRWLVVIQQTTNSQHPPYKLANLLIPAKKWSFQIFILMSFKTNCFFFQQKKCLIHGRMNAVYLSAKCPLLHVTFYCISVKERIGITQKCNQYSEPWVKLHMIIEPRRCAELPVVGSPCIFLHLLGCR